MISTTTRTGFPSVNLLPPETRERQKTRRRTGVVVVAGIAALALVGGIYYLERSKVADLKGKVTAQEATNTTLQQQVTTLQPYAQLKESLASRQGLVQTALAGDVSWSNVLHELATSVPSKAWLLSMSATQTAPGAVATTGATTPGTNLSGSLTFTGDSLNTDTLSSFLVQLQSEPGWVNAWMSSAQKSVVGTTHVWSFNSSIDLTKRVLSRRGGGSQ